MAEEYARASNDAEKDDRRRRAVLPGLVLVALIIILILLLINFLRSSGSQTVTERRSSIVVPSVVGMTRSNAESALKRAGFKVDATTRTVGDANKAGKVLSQIPVAGETLSRGAEVAITVAAESIPVVEGDVGTHEQPDRVPDVVGDPRTTGVSTISAAGYNVSVSELYSDTVSKGLIITQNPSGGTDLVTGETVDVVVSAGAKAAANVKVPDVIGLSRAAAASKIKAAGLTPYAVYGPQPAGAHGTTFNQWPEPGTLIEAGSQVTYQTGY